jgi:hypothetical protein
MIIAEIYDLFHTNVKPEGKKNVAPASGATGITRRNP